MASDSEASCVSDPNFAVICSFLEKFGASCGITSPDFLELQEMLENTQELSQELIDIHIKLLRKVRRSVSADRWERVLIKLCHTYCTQDAWELERFGYKKARLTSKLRILKNLMEMQFDFNQKFKAEVNRQTASELRTEPIGRDKHGHSYWYQIDEHCQLRVYREDPDEETWALVANDREGLVRLISQLASDDPNLADIALNDDSNSLEIEKPILDTGQTSSSTSNCEAEVDESSGGNEDSKDVLPEPQMDTPPAKTTATETSIIEKSTLVVKKLEVEEKPAENKIKLRISTSSIIPLKPEEQPENLASVKTEKDFKLEKVKKSIGIDLSVPQISIQTHVKGVDLSNKRKKSINDLAANLRMKTHDRLYKNPVQEQEMDLSVKKPSMDPKQFSSLSVPPFEPISIESALRMSSEFAESDEEVEDEEDEFDDEDEIELPSHMKQPRLSRPTLLGNSKKKTYSDEDDEEYGEEIEEPVMLIQGEGSGKDCDNENINVNKSEEYSEAVEEAVMFFYGEGSGQDCDTGNTGKEEKSTSSDKNATDLKDANNSKVVQSNTLESIHTKEQVSELKTIKDTESASSSSSEVLEATDKQITEQCLEKTVVDCDSKDIKSELLVNESKHSVSQKNEQSPKCHKVGTVIVDVKSGDRGQTSDAVSLKRSSRWDIGKPEEYSKKNDISSRKQLCDDSTNSSIINNENSELKLLNVCKDETNNTISDISVTDVKTAVNKTSELRKLDESNRDSDKKDIELENKDNLSVALSSDTHEALIDQKTDELKKSETDETDEAKKQPLFFFGPGCFQFKTPMAPYSPDVKGLNTKDTDLILQPNELLQRNDQENETCTEKNSSTDILGDNTEQTTFLQTTNLSSKIESMSDAKCSENVDLKKENDSKDNTPKSSIYENIELTENVTELKEKICTSETEVKSTSIDNKEEVDKIRKSDNNPCVVEAKQIKDTENLVRGETTEVKNPVKLSSKTSTEEEYKLPDETTEEKKVENNDTPVIESETRNEDSNKSAEEIETNLEESSKNLVEGNTTNTTDFISQKELASEQQKIISDQQNIVDSSAILKSNDSKSDEKESTSVVEGKLEIELDRIEVTKALDTNISTSKQSQNLTDEDNESNSSFIIAQDKLSSSKNIESCSTNLEKITEIGSKETQENIDTEKNICNEAEKGSSSPKESDDITDDKSETLSETLESLSTLIESKSDESDDQLKKSDKDDESSNNENMLRTESNLNPTDEISPENDTKSTEENVPVISEISKESTFESIDNNEVTPVDEKISENNTRLSEGNVSVTSDEIVTKSTDENVPVISEISESIDNNEITPSDNNKKNTEDISDLDTNKSSTFKEHIAVNVIQNTSLISEENTLVSVIEEKSVASEKKSDLQVDTKGNLKCEKLADQEAVSSTVVLSKNISTTVSEKIKVKHPSSPDQEKSNTGTNDQSVSITIIEKDLATSEDKSKPIDIKLIDSQPLSSATETAKIDLPVHETLKNDVNVSEEPKSELTSVEVSTSDDAVTELKYDTTIKTSEGSEFDDFEANKNSKSSESDNKIQSDKSKSDTVVESVSEIRNDEAKSETIFNETITAKEDINVESVNIEANSVCHAQNNDTIVDDDLTIPEDKNKECPTPVIEPATESPSYKTKLENIVDLPIAKEDKNTDSIIPVIKSISRDQSDKIKSETKVDELTTSEDKNINSVVEDKFKTIVDEPTPITREGENVVAIDEADPNSELQKLPEVEETKNVDTKIESSESITEAVNDSKIEPVVDELTKEIYKEEKSLKKINLEVENINVKSVAKSKIDECKQKLLDESTVKVNVSNTETVHFVPESVQDKNEKNILQTEQECTEYKLSQLPKSNQSEQEFIKDNSVEDSLKNEMEINVENESASSIEPVIHEKEQKIEKPTHNVILKTEDNKKTEISKNIEPEVTVKSISKQKEFQTETILPSKDEIGINKDISETDPGIITDNVKHNCQIVTEQISNKSEKLEQNLKIDEKVIPEISKALENDKHSVEVNHVAVKTDTDNEKGGDKIEKHVLKNPKHVDNMQGEVKESLHEKISDSVLKSPVTVDDITKNNEYKKVKHVKISTLETAAVKGKIDDITLETKPENTGKLVKPVEISILEPAVVKEKIDNITLETKVENPGKSVECKKVKPVEICTLNESKAENPGKSVKESKKDKSVEISTLEPAIAEEKIDEKKSDAVTLESKVENPGKSVECKKINPVEISSLNSAVTKEEKDKKKIDDIELESKLENPRKSVEYKNDKPVEISTLKPAVTKEKIDDITPESKAENPGKSVQESKTVKPVEISTLEPAVAKEKIEEKKCDNITVESKVKNAGKSVECKKEKPVEMSTLEPAVAKEKIDVKKSDNITVESKVENAGKSIECKKEKPVEISTLKPAVSKEKIDDNTLESKTENPGKSVKESAIIKPAEISTLEPVVAKEKKSDNITVDSKVENAGKSVECKKVKPVEISTLKPAVTKEKIDDITLESKAENPGKSVQENKTVEPVEISTLEPAVAKEKIEEKKSDNITVESKVENPGKSVTENMTVKPVEISTLEPAVAKKKIDKKKCDDITVASRVENAGKSVECKKVKPVEITTLKTTMTKDKIDITLESKAENPGKSVKEKIIKPVEISTLEPAVVKEKIDEKKSDDITIKSKVENPEKSVECKKIKLVEISTLKPAVAKEKIDDVTLESKAKNSEKSVKECKKIKLVEISTLKPAVAKEKIDDVTLESKAKNSEKSVEISTLKSAVTIEKIHKKKIDDITLESKAENPGKSVQECKTIKTTLVTQVAKEKTDIKRVDERTSEAIVRKKENLAGEISVNSHEIEVKEVKTSGTKENLKFDSVFDQIKETNKSASVSEKNRKDSVSIQKNTKITVDVTQSRQNNEDSSDDDMMDSTAFEHGNDDNDDSHDEDEEKSGAEEKDNIADKVEENKEKVNHTNIKIKETGSKIVLKNINDLISYKHKILDDTLDPLKSEVTLTKVVATRDSVKKLVNKSKIDVEPNVDIIKIEAKDKRTINVTSKNKSKTKTVDSKLVDKQPKLICVDITKLQEKSPSKPENKTIVELKQQSDISSPRSLESIGVDNEESSDVIDVPETDPLACSDDEILLSKRMEEESTKRKPKGLSLATFKLDDTEEADTTALIPEPIARALRNRKISVEAVNTSSRKRKSDAPIESSGPKKRRGRGRKPGNMGNRPEVVRKDVSSSDEEDDIPLEVKVVTPQRGTGKARRGRGRGRGRGAAHIERIANDSPVLSSDPQSETSRTEVTPVPTVQKTEQKTPPSRKKRRVLGLDIDPAAIIQKTESDDVSTRSSVRQSRRIAQIKIKEEAERRKIEELTYIPDHKEHKKKKKKKDDDKDFKIEKKKTKYKEITEEEESEEEVTEITSKTKHKKKRKPQDVRKLFNTANPWQSSSESSTSNEEEEEDEVEEEPSDEETAVVKSDHEFSPESDLESNMEIQPLRRARTVKKESDTEEPTDEHACQKCGKADHPEWILLCDKCDCGWHCSCLRPALLVIPEGDWFCPPCQHLTLIEALKSQLEEYDKKMNRREMEVRRKQRLAYVGISLDNVLPSKDTETAKDDDNNQDQEMVSGDDSSESGSDSETGSSSGDESEPIYQLRERRQAHSYRFNDYDALINSAIQDELEAVKGAGNQGRGKDIATIVNAEKEEAQALEQQKLQEPEFERPPPVVPVYVEKPQREPGSEDSSDEGPRVVPKHSGRKKHRKLNSLDISSEDDADDDEDFKGTSASEEEDIEDLGSDDSELDGRRGKGRSGPTRRSTRARTTRYDREFINDDSEDEAPRRKKVRSIWDESESEESDKSWGRRKKSKKQRHSLTPRSSKKSRKRKRRNDDSDPEVRSRPKKPKIKYGGLNDSDDELLTRRTRGKKINYIDALGSDSEEDKDKDKRKSKPLESEDEYVANEDDEDAEEALEPVEDEEKDSDPEPAQSILPVQRKIIKIIAPSKVLKGRGKGGIPRPQHLKPVTPPPPPPPPPPVVPESEPVEETSEDVEEEEEETEPPVPADIPVIAANPEDLNEEEVGTMMMENEEYAKKQLELMAIQLAKEKKKKEKEAKKLAEKKELVVSPLPVSPPAVVVPAQPKKRGRKKKSEIEAIAAAAAVAAAAAATSIVAVTPEPPIVPPITINPALIQLPIQNPVMPLEQPDSVEKLTPPRPNINVSPCEIPSTVPTVVSDLTNSPPKRRGRGKGKKTLAAEAAATTPETVTDPTIIPPPPASNSPSLQTMPVPAQNDPQNLSPNPTMHGGKLGIATPPQPFSQNQPTPSVITRMLQSQPMSAQTFTSSANTINQKYFPPEQQPPRGAPPGQFPPIAGRGRVPSPYRQSPPAIGMFPGVRPITPNSPHRLRSPGPPNMQMFHSTHHSMDPSPSGGGPINIIAPSNRDRSSPGNVGSPTPPPPPYSRATMTANRFSPNENSPGPSLPPPIRHQLFQPSPPPRPPPPGNFSPYHPPPPPNYHYGAYPPAPSLAAADDALPPTDYQGSPYPEHYNTAEGTVHSSEGSNSKPFDEEGSGEFGGLVSYFSSQREDDLDT